METMRAAKKRNNTGEIPRRNTKEETGSSATNTAHFYISLRLLQAHHVSTHVIHYMLQSKNTELPPTLPPRRHDFFSVDRRELI
jgi:hypothetical protein